MQALSKYWRDFDADASATLLAATQPDRIRLSQDVARMTGELERLLAQRPETGEDVDAAARGPIEPEHHLAGPHPMPPGTRPLQHGEAVGAAAKLPRLMEAREAAPATTANAAPSNDAVLAQLAQLAVRYTRAMRGETTVAARDLRPADRKGSDQLALAP